jgi:hypothetical protein
MSTVKPLLELEVVSPAGRVRLSALEQDAFESMALWLPGALAPEWSIDELQGAVTEGRGVLICDAAGEAIGMAIVRLDAPVARAASVPFLSIAPERRYRGLGGEAGIALQRYLSDQLGYERVYAPVPDGRGLAVYFWLRLGFRPLTQSEAPWALMGLGDEEPKRGMWMLRDEA